MAASPPVFDGSNLPLSIIVMGVCGSGKSAVAALLAEKLGYPFIEGDDLHPRCNVDKMAAGHPLDDEDRWPWLETIVREVERPGPVVVSCSALKKAYRNVLRTAKGHETVFVFLDPPLDVLRDRMARRTSHFMPATLLETQMSALEKPTGEAGVLTLPQADSVQSTVLAAIRSLERQRKN